MYFKLALRNVKKSFKDYLIYFLTIAFSICLFYTFNSFQEQQAVLDVNAAQGDIIQGLLQIMTILSVIVAIVLAFLIIYANNFLIKRRKKELGLYTLLGMNKSKISYILIYETFLIGLLSLIIGILTGLIASQLLTVMSANLFRVALDYHFIFSMDATIKTITSFALIFFIIMVFNSLSLNKYKLIDLLHADQKNESLKIKKLYISIILFVLSIALLAYAYYTAWSNGILAFNMLLTIVPAGLLGTVLFFMSLSGFLLRFIQTSKHLYFKKLNMFVLRQINASINSNFLSMSIVCIMLLFSIGALSSGLNINATINNTIIATTPFDYSYTSLDKDLKDIKAELRVDTSTIEKDLVIHNYASDHTLVDFLPYLSDKSISETGLKVQQAQSYEILPLSQFNQLREHMGLPSIALTEKQGYLFTTAEAMNDPIQDILSHQPTLSIYNHDITIANDAYDPLYAATTFDTSTLIFCVVIQDDLIPPNTPLNASYWNVDVKEDVDIISFQASIEDAMTKHNEQIGSDEYMKTRSISSNDVQINSRGMSVTFTYIGLYLGFVFLIASAVILALQQLSQASDNRKRYELLRKIGADEKMLNHSILLQLGIYFIMPLLLALAHSVVGIQTVNSLTVFLGRVDIFLPSIITVGIIILIYGSYFLITYMSYKRILKP